MACCAHCTAGCACTARQEARAAFERDRRRDAILTRAGYLVLRTTWLELTTRPHALVARVAEALTLGKARRWASQ